MSHQKTAKCHIYTYYISDFQQKSIFFAAQKKSTHKNKKTAFLMVLTGVGNYAYKRPEDGVLVVPIGCLKD